MRGRQCLGLARATVMFCLKFLYMSVSWYLRIARERYQWTIKWLSIQQLSCWTSRNAWHILKPSPWAPTELALFITGPTQIKWLLYLQLLLFLIHLSWNVLEPNSHLGLDSNMVAQHGVSDKFHHHKYVWCPCSVCDMQPVTKNPADLDFLQHLLWLHYVTCCNTTTLTITICNVAVRHCDLHVVQQSYHAA